MVDIFKNISSTQVQALQDALPLIVILIGKADDNLDLKELELAKKIVHIRTYNAPEYLNPFYEQIEKDFDHSLELFLKELPQDKPARNAEITTRLELINEILPKLHPKIAYQIYQGYIRLASEIAKASGGFLGFLSVNPNESKWVQLPMITPIQPTEEGEDEEE